MGAVAEFRSPPPAFGLEPIFEVGGEVTVQRPVSGRGERVLLRIRNGDQRELTEALLEDPNVDDVELLNGSPPERLYVVEWDGFAERIAPFAEHGGVVETMWGCDDGWHVPTVFPTREAIRRTYDHLVERGRTPRIDRLYDLAATDVVPSVSVDA